MRVFDYDRPTDNHFLAVQQLEVHGELYHRRGDYSADLRERIKKTGDSQTAAELRRKLHKTVETEVCVVVSSEQNEVDKFRKLRLEIEPHRRKMTARNLEKEFKDPEHPFRLAIVCAMWITGFDAQCVSTVYLDKLIKGHTLMQTIARANRVYGDEKENGLIVDYGNVYRQLEKAYAIYGEGTGGTGGNAGKPERDLAGLAAELDTAIENVRNYLAEHGFTLGNLQRASSMEKISLLPQAADCLSLNPTTRTNFEFMARHVFRKYKALFPEPEAKPFLRAYNAIETIYNYLNQKVITADVTAVIARLQTVVSDSVTIQDDVAAEPVFVDLASLNFEQIKAAFAKTERNNTVVFDLQAAIQQKLERMLQEKSAAP